MPPRPSLNQRSNGGSQSGTRGNEHRDDRAHGPAPRNRNASYAAGPPTNHSNTSVSTSEQMNNTSPQPNELVGGERHPRNLERDGFRDPGNHKRKLNQAITEVLISSFKKLKTEYVSYF
jgi:hypothetical protein